MQDTDYIEGLYINFVEKSCVFGMNVKCPLVQ
jgi:hypothetical protein